jgi:hypothetical protein
LSAVRLNILIRICCFVCLLACFFLSLLVLLFFPLLLLLLSSSISAAGAAAAGLLGCCWGWVWGAKPVFIENEVVFSAMDGITERLGAGGLKT